MVPPAPAAATPPDDRRWSGRYVPAPSRLSFATLPDQLFGSWVLDLDATPPSLAPASGPVRVLESLGDRRYRQDDRVQATFALTEAADGAPMLSASYLTLRRISPFEFTTLWIITITGVVALLYFLVAPLWRRRTVRGAWREPGFVGASAFVLGIGALALQPWQQLGDPTPATIALALGSLALPFAAAWECLRAGSRRARPTIDGVRLAAGVSIIALFALLDAYGLWPILSWRL
jgi:hypothetical protein